MDGFETGGNGVSFREKDSVAGPRLTEHGPATRLITDADHCTRTNGITAGTPLEFKISSI